MHTGSCIPDVVDAGTAQGANPRQMRTIMSRIKNQEHFNYEVREVAGAEDAKYNIWAVLELNNCTLLLGPGNEQHASPFPHNPKSLPAPHDLGEPLWYPE